MIRTLSAALLAVLSAALPATAAEVLVGSWSSSSVLRYDEASGAFRGAFVTSGQGGLQLPHTGTFGPDGALYVASFGNSRVLRYDGATGAYLGDFLAPGAGGLSGPMDVLFAPDGTVWVTSFNTNRVLRYDRTTGAFLGDAIALGNSLSGPTRGTFGPDGSFYLGSFNTSFVLRYDGSTGAFLGVVASPATSPLNGPRDVTFGPDGALYVASYGNARVLRYAAPSGAYLGEFVSPGNGLTNPNCLRFRGNRLLVTAEFANAVLRYDALSGTFVDSLVFGGLGGLSRATFLAFRPDPPPTTFCQGKLNSIGCVPFLTTVGTPSTSAPGAFLIRGNRVLQGEAGLLLYGFGKANLSFHGGRLCVKSPLSRIVPPKLATGGGPAFCPGLLTRDFNARIQSGTDPRLTAGAVVTAQWRQRDPADPAGFGDSLTDAITFTVLP